MSRKTIIHTSIVDLNNHHHCFTENIGLDLSNLDIDSINSRMNLFTSIAIKKNIKLDKCQRWAEHLTNVRAGPGGPGHSGSRVAGLWGRGAGARVGDPANPADAACGAGGETGIRASRSATGKNSQKDSDLTAGHNQLLQKPTQNRTRIKWLWPDHMRFAIQTISRLLPGIMTMLGHCAGGSQQRAKMQCGMKAVTSRQRAS